MPSRDSAAVAGLDEPAALAVYLPLVRQTLANAEALGVANALTGPFTRGDAGTLAAHLEALAAHAPDVVALYRALGGRELRLARERGSLTPEAADRLAVSLQTSPDTVGLRHAAQHRRKVRGTACGAIRPPFVTGPGAPARPSQARTFQPSSPRQTVLRQADLSPLVQLRASWRAVRPAPRRQSGGLLRPIVAMHWAGRRHGLAGPPPSAASAPWRA